VVHFRFVETDFTAGSIVSARTAGWVMNSAWPADTLVIAALMLSIRRG